MFNGFEWSPSATVLLSAQVPHQYFSARSMCSALSLSSSCLWILLRLRMVGESFRQQGIRDHYRAVAPAPALRRPTRRCARTARGKQEASRSLHVGVVCQGSVGAVDHSGSRHAHHSQQRVAAGAAAGQGGRQGMSG